MSNSINRRAIITAIAAVPTGAVAATLPSQASPKSAYDRAKQHWQAFSEALADITPVDCRVQIFGSIWPGRSANVAMEFMITVEEEIYPGKLMSVERNGGNLRLDANGWNGEDAI